MVTSAAIAQTAKVIELSYADTQRIQQLEKEKTEVEAKIAEFNNHIVDTYLLSTLSNSGTCSSYRYLNPNPKDPEPLPGIFCNSQSWCLQSNSKENDLSQKRWLERHPMLNWVWCDTRDSFEYSTDYRFIVPKALPNSTYNGPITWDGGTFTTSPVMNGTIDTNPNGGTGHVTTY
jgi:hypothetical protein